MCGIVGGYSPNLVEMLCRIQHRGFTSCGFVSEHSEQFADRVHHLNKVQEPGIGHVRYATNVTSVPMPIKYRDAWLAFNGDIANGDTGKLAEALYHGETVNGAYSFVWMRNGHIFAGCDPNGFRPLYIARVPGVDQGFVAASETTADPSLTWREVSQNSLINLKTGEGGWLTEYDHRTPHAACAFEDVYFSHVNNSGTWRKRRELGKLICLPRKGQGIDAIVPVPESAIAAAEALSEDSGIPMVSAIVRNRYSERTFITEEGVDAKYTIVGDAIRGKVIVLVDDSIVRGNTMNTLVPELKKYASEVHVRVTFPPIRHACPYGIRIDGAGCWDIPSADSLLFMDARYFNGCKACVDGVYLSKDAILPAMVGFSV